MATSSAPPRSASSTRLKVSKQKDSSAPETSTTSGASSSPTSSTPSRSSACASPRRKTRAPGRCSRSQAPASTDAVRMSSSANGNPASRSTWPKRACGSAVVLVSTRSGTPAACRRVTAAAAPGSGVHDTPSTPSMSSSRPSMPVSAVMGRA